MNLNNNTYTREPITEKIQHNAVMMGCDPEFFFEKKGQIIGSEKVIDIKKGLPIKLYKSGSNPSIGKGESKFIVDGVQAELNPKPDTCRARLGNEISQCFSLLYEKMQTDKELSINFNPTVQITKNELMSLDEQSRKFGCTPSKNTDKKLNNSICVKDATKYKYRSAGGHIHLGFQGCESKIKTVMKEPERLIQIMDIIVGNTCVLIDRDIGNIERRKNYGRAGEFRTPPHGIEYRTLSNFWLKSYPLMSFVMSLARFSVNILANTMPGRDYEKELLSLIDMKKIKKAINTNDFNMAWNNFQKIKPFLARITPENESFPLTQNNLKNFEFFIKKGINYWFKEDPLQHWMKIPEGHTAGWETFLRDTVSPKMMELYPTKAPNVK